MVLKEGDLRAQHPYGIAPAGFRLPDRTRVGAVHLQIGELDRSVDYYREIIGLQVFERTVDGAILGARGTDLPLVRLHAREGTRPVTRGGKLRAVPLCDPAAGPRRAWAVGFASLGNGSPRGDGGSPR